jgi:acyl transferase domain-containing protein
VRAFDHTMFGMSPQEARTFDPAQRKLIETVYEAFESSGTPLSKLSGSKTGCFIGNFNFDHQLMQYRDTEYPEPYGTTGGGIALLSNRISYLFNLHGPSLTLDTACSSSMYALHLACSAIQSGECNAAVVGGSNLSLTPECQVFSSTLGAVSKTSKCHTFDIAADGYARADGVGALYIKTLKQAIKDKDLIRAVIRATAINA